MWCFARYVFDFFLCIYIYLVVLCLGKGGGKEKIRRRRSRRLMCGLAGIYYPIERYWELMKESQIKGYLFQQQNYLPGDENPGG